MAPAISKVGTIAMFFTMALAGCGGKDLGSSQARSPGATRLDDKGPLTTTATGSFKTSSTNTGVRSVGGLLVVTQDITFTATGDLSGTAPAQDTVILNPSTGTGTFFGSGTLSGTVLGKSGSIGFVFVGSFSGYPSLPQLQGRIVFLEGTGTGQLSGLSGEGTLQGILDVGGTYSIEVRFAS